MAKKNLSRIVNDAKNLVGFGAVVKYGRILNKDEIKKLADYACVLGGDRKYAISVLNNLGRPYDISDVTFRKRCLLCGQLNNYCCC